MLSPASLLVAAVLAASPPAHEQDPAKDLLGAWRCENGPIKFLEFHAKKLALYAEANGQKQLAFFPVVYHPGKIQANMMGKKTTWAFELKGDELTLTIKEDGNPLSGTMVYRRLRETPEELQVKTLELGKPGSLSEEALDKIRKELADRVKTDQAVRTDPKKAADMGKVDGENTAWLIKLIKEVGWIEATGFGPLASNNAFLLVQHSGNLSLMTTALPLIKKDVLARKLDAQPYALLYDRLMLFTGEKQRYGTQLGQNEKGEYVVSALEDRARVEEFRKAIGLFPLSQYLKMFGNKKIVFEDD